MAQLEHIEAIDKRLWNAADTLRANSNYASNEYSIPVMGLIFLRKAYSRYVGVKDEIEANLPKREGKTRALTNKDFSQKTAILLRPKAQFDYLVSLPDSDAPRKKSVGPKMNWRPSESIGHRPPTFGSAPPMGRVERSRHAH